MDESRWWEHGSDRQLQHVTPPLGSMPSVDPTDKSALSRAVANTYQPESDATGWELCQQYQQVLEYQAEYPDAGRVRVANVVFDGEVSANRLRPWLDGGMPDSMRGLQACKDHGWLDLNWDGPMFHNLAVAVAWIFSGGSIAKNNVPRLAVTPATRSLSQRLIESLGVSATITRDDEEGRGTEVRPTEAAAPLGRLLSILGAPTGQKNADAALTLPAWLADAPHSVRLAFARTYVTNRGTDRSIQSQTALQISEQRSEKFRRSLASFFDTVAGRDVTCVNQHVIYVTEDGKQLFNKPPTLKE